MDEKDQALCNVQAALRVYTQEIANCPRSPEWKRGARDGVCQVFGLPMQGNPYASGTAQQDARRAGFLAGRQLALEAQEKLQAQAAAGVA